MADKIFINLPVTDVAASRAFYEGLGFGIDENFSNEGAVTVQISDSIFAMMLSRDFYATFTDKTIGDARTTSLALMCLGFDNQAELDAILAKVEAVGGKLLKPAALDEHGMYGGTMEDPDGHGWELLWLGSVPTG